MPAPRPAFLPFSVSSTFASSISWRTSFVVCSERSRRRSAVDSSRRPSRMSVSAMVVTSPGAGRRMHRNQARVRKRSGVAFAIVKMVSGLIIGAALAASVAGCGSSPGDPTKGARVVHVVAAENMWGDVVKQIGGRHASVASIISDPQADPHLYASDPRDAARLATANLVVVNGLGYDDFARKLLSASPSSKRHVLSMAKALSPGGHDSNPHLWYDVPRLPAAAHAIADAIAAEDPVDASYFRANASRFVASLQPLLATVTAMQNRHPGAPVAYTERVPGYLLEAAGLTIRTPPG